MEVFDLERAHFVQYRHDPYELVITTVEREPNWLKQHINKFETFWQEVEMWKVLGWRNHPSQRKKRDLETFQKECLIE